MTILKKAARETNKQREYIRGTFGERIEDVESILNYEGKEISNWYKDNLLMCNHEKFQSMSLGSNNEQ